MFSESADLYDKIHAQLKNYSDETGKVAAWIKKVLPDAQSLLDVACGTGEHDRFLSSDYHVDGIDLNPEFLRIAKVKNPAGQYCVANMINFDLDRRYDVVICLFSSIGYVQTLENLHATLASFHHPSTREELCLLSRGFTPEAWKTGRLHLTTLDEDQLKVCRMNISKIKDGRLVFHDPLSRGNSQRSGTF